MSVGRYDCLDDNCDGPVIDAAEDPFLPPHIERFECEGCGQIYLLDVETGEIEIDE